MPVISFCDSRGIAYEYQLDFPRFFFIANKAKRRRMDTVNVGKKVSESISSPGEQSFITSGNSSGQKPSRHLGEGVGCLAPCLCGTCPSFWDKGIDRYPVVRAELSCSGCPFLFVPTTRVFSRRALRSLPRGTTPDTPAL